MFIDKFQENRFNRRHPSWLPSRIMLKEAGNEEGAGSNSGSNAGSGTGNANNQGAGTSTATKDGSSATGDEGSSDDDDDEEDDLENVELTPAQQKLFNKRMQDRLDREKRRQKTEREREATRQQQEQLRADKKWEELIKQQTTELDQLRPVVAAYEELKNSLSDKLDVEIAKWPKSIRAAFREDMEFAEKYRLAESLRGAALALITGQQQTPPADQQQGTGQQNNGQQGTGANHKDPPASNQAGGTATEEAAKKTHAAIYGRGL